MQKLQIHLQSLCRCYGNNLFLVNENPGGVFPQLADPLLHDM